MSKKELGILMTGVLGMTAAVTVLLAAGTNNTLKKIEEEIEVIPIEILLEEEQKEIVERIAEIEIVVATSQQGLLTEEERNLLAAMVEAEAGNQDLLGKRLVVDTVLTRMASDNFPDTVIEVITQQGAYASYENGAMNRVVASESTYRAIELELQEQLVEVAYFRTKKYHIYGTPYGKIGDHYFSKE